MKVRVRLAAATIVLAAAVHRIHRAALAPPSTL